MDNSTYFRLDDGDVCLCQGVGLAIGGVNKAVQVVSDLSGADVSRSH